MKQGNQSNRQLLLKRIKQDSLAQRLTNNLEKLNQSYQRLNMSRISTNSNNSLTSNKHLYHSTIHFQNINKTPSKTQLLQEISKKLELSKSISKTPKHYLTRTNLSQNQQSQPAKAGVARMAKPKTNKLQLMLKGIKKCNEMSTKVIYSTKKNKQDKEQQVDQPFFGSRSFKIVNNQMRLSSQSKEGNIKKMFDELLNVKQQLRKMKQENKMLIQMVKDTNRNQIKGLPCPYCKK